MKSTQPDDCLVAPHVAIELLVMRYEVAVWLDYELREWNGAT